MRGMNRYELLVGQPSFYTNSVYAVIRHIVKDPVKYPDNMSPHFKSFLEGLLDKVPENRLSWPALLEYPFIKETSDELVAREIPATAAASRAHDAAWREDGNLLCSSTASSAASLAGKRNLSPATEKTSAQTVSADSRAESPLLMNNSSREEPGLVSSGCQALDRLENISLTVKGATSIGQDNEALASVMLPLKTWPGGSSGPCRLQVIRLMPRLEK